MLTASFSRGLAVVWLAGWLLLGWIPAVKILLRKGRFSGINAYEHGLGLYRRKSYVRAEKRLREALAERDNSLRARYALASLLLDTGRSDDAAQQADELRRRYPGSAISSELLARVEAARGNAEAANEALYAAADAARTCGATRFADLLLAGQAK